MEDKFPNLFTWEHPVFESAEYLLFKRQILAAVHAAIPPAQSALDEIVPEVANEIRNTRNASDTKLGALTAQIASIGEQMTRIEGQNSQFLALLSSGQIGLTLQSGTQRTVAGSVVNQTSAAGNHVAAGTCVAAGADVGGRVSMSRSLLTVKEVWDEWSKGGSTPPIKKLEEDGFWRKGRDAESRFFQRRYLIIKKIILLVDFGMDEVEAVEVVEVERGTRSLNKFSEDIAKAASAERSAKKMRGEK